MSFVVLYDKPYRRASAAWYRAGGAPAPVAAYQPKGAASLAASYVNLANPGTYDAAPGTAPAWAAATGWTFNGINTVLETGITGGNAYSVIVLFSGATLADRAMFGESTTVGNQTRLNIYPRYTTPRAYFRSGGSYDQATNYASGVIGVTPAQAYYGGAPLGALAGAWVGVTVNTIALGCHKANGVNAEFWNGSMQAFVIYLATLTDAQVAAVSAAMALL